VNQKTVTNQICARGIGPDTQRQVHITLKPAAENTGIVFRRMDTPESVELAATINNASIHENQLVFRQGEYAIHNVEHLLAACYGAGVHNLFVELDGPELPKMTDSAAAYVFLLQAAGIKKQQAQRMRIAIDEPQLFRHRDGWIRATEFDGLRIGCVNTLTENSVSVQRSSAVVDISEATFVSELCHARANTAHLCNDSNLNKAALQNRQTLLQRSHLNHMVVEVMAFLSLTDADIDACYTSFDADLALHLDAVRSLVNSIERQPHQTNQCIKQA
jgi:UDP-3-O-acyl-N-acetylglucosamine deacetylase